MNKIILTIGLLCCSFANANLPEVWLFGIKSQQFYNIHKLQQTHLVKHYLIDGGRDFEKQISKGLSKNENEARKQVAKLFAKNKKIWEEQAKSGWQGAINAQAIGIKKVPAITFDRGKTVIYGVLDTAKAYKIWNNKKWRIK